MDLGDVMQAGVIGMCSRFAPRQQLPCAAAAFVGHVVGDAIQANVITGAKAVANIMRGNYADKTAEAKAGGSDASDKEHGLSVADLLIYEIPGGMLGKHLSEAPCSVVGGVGGTVATFACEAAASYLVGSNMKEMAHTIKEALDAYQLTDVMPREDIPEA